MAEQSNVNFPVLPAVLRLSRAVCRKPLRGKGTSDGNSSFNRFREKKFSVLDLELIGRSVIVSKYKL